MAMIDYGAIAFKNGKLISTGMFTPMKKMVGWADNKNSMYHDAGIYENNRPYLKENYFAYIGDKEYTAAFYKCMITIVRKSGDGYWRKSEYFNCSYYTWSKWEYPVINDGNIIVTKRNGYYVCRWNYKGDKYKVYFGHGVDFDSYKKWHIVNYYRSLPCMMRDLKWNLEQIIHKWRTKWK